MNHSDRYYEYEIHVVGHLDERWFEGLAISQTPEGETIISGRMDQAALHGVLSRVRDLGLVLLSIQSGPKLTFSRALAQHLPATYALLQAANLVVHPTVERVVLHGSRGLAGGARPDSDIDLSLIVALPSGSSALERECLLRSVFETTFNAWQADIEPDLAVVFETRACALRCFTQTNWREDLCAVGGLDCFGLYKAQKGFQGLVTNAGIQVKRMYPCLEIWRRPLEEGR
jgi:hypothetical protein